MDVSFADDSLRALCKSQRVAAQALGHICARKLRARVADLEAANSVLRLPAGMPREGDHNGHYVVTLDAGQLLVIEPAMDRVPRTTSGSVRWEAVTKVRVVRIGDAK